MPLFILVPQVTISKRLDVAGIAENRIRMLPPLVLLFNYKARLFGLPAEMIYLFLAWLGMVGGTAWFAYRLPHEVGSDKSEEPE